MTDAPVRAPFTPAQVEALNAWQGRSDRHPFTCPADGTHGSERHSDRRILAAHEDGWRCDMCAYRQAWAHAFMAQTECRFCGEPLGGGPGGWHSLTTTLERCSGPSTTSFHEPRTAPRTRPRRRTQ